MPLLGDDYQDLTCEMPQGIVEDISTDVLCQADEAQLIVLVGDEVGRKYDLRNELVLGRDSRASLKLTGSDISRSHARIYKTQNKEFYIEDLGSCNGTAINGEMVKTRALKFGDTIRLGRRTVLLFTYSDTVHQRLNHLQKMETIGQLAGGVAHEFNNVLAVVLNNMSFLEKLVDIDFDEMQNCVSETKTAALRGKEIAKQLLNFSRSSSSEKSQVNFSELALENIKMIRRTFPRLIEIRANIESNLSLHGNDDQFNQLLVNLCINSREAMPNGGLLELSAVTVHLSDEKAAVMPPLRAGPHLQLIVKDSGIGIPKEDLNRVFEPFFTTKDPGEGTGLGLSTVFRAVRNHNGTINVESKPGSGTSFVIHIPFNEPIESDLNSSSFETILPSPQQKTVFVVDDEILVQRSTKRLLTSFGYSVICASNGLEALEIYKKNHRNIDAVILDMIMPKLGGKETYLAFREINPYVKALIISGYSEEKTIQSMLDLGVVCFLRKPLSPGKLHAAINMALEENP